MKKIVFLLLVTLLLFSCVNSDIRNSNIASGNNNHIAALSYLEKHLYKQAERLDPEVLINYQLAWNKGREYYDSIIRQNLANSRDMLNYKENYYELYKSYFSLPQATKEKLPLIVAHKNELESSRKSLVASYVEYGDQLPSISYQNRLHKYLIYKKAGDYALPTDMAVFQKLQQANAGLEKNIKVDILNTFDFYFKNSIQSKLENALLKEKLFSISHSGNYHLLFQVRIDNYQFLRSQPSFSSTTEYKTIKESYDKVENGKIIKAYKEIRVPYQKLVYGKKSRLSYLCSYALYDKEQNIVFQQSLPCHIEDSKTWHQYISLDSHFIDLPKNEVEPASLSQEELIEKSFSPVIRSLKRDMEALKKY
ncbi:MAG: hypothetical protein SPH94_01550 [Fusobacterium necrophorum]|nr:hypothetical protein [Fusobacterium necrophorum]